jgi:hypothetical protein
MSEHPDTRLIHRYTTGDQDLDEVTLWSLEAHLESCSECRDQQADLLLGPEVAGGLDTGRAVLQRVALELDERIRIGPGPQPAGRQWRAVGRRWAVWSLIPWIAMTVGVLLAALGLSRIAPENPSLVLLIAPVLPLLGVAGTWSRRTDPAWELIAGSPRVGLWLLLRRTAVVLAVVIPLLLLAGWAGGLSPALWLLPCLGLVLTTLAVGERVGLVPAAVGIWAVWTFTVLVPSLLTSRVPSVLTAAAAPGWIALILLAAGTVAVRRAGYPRLISRL